MISRRVLGGLALIALAALAGCGDGGVVGADVEVTLKAKDNLRFEPNVIAAKVGQSVNVTIDNAGMAEHAFVIDQLGVNSGRIPAGQQAVVSFTAEKAGSFTFYSSLPGERTGGMVGTLTVTQ
jgi:plastocyanin